MDTQTHAALLEAVDTFLASFEGVFHFDWDYTKAALGIMDSQDTSLYLHPEGTFLVPGVDDESNNWGCRGGLLQAYRHLKACMDHERNGA